MIKFIQPNIVLYFFLLLLGMSGFFIAVLWPQNVGFYAFIVLTAMGGFGVALYIFRTKRGSGNLVCPTGSNCSAVITSRYSKFLGIPIEYLGMAYYFTIIIAYTTLIFALQAFPTPLLSVLITLTTGAFLFSLYLLFAQAFLLRQWCIWCLLSAMFSIVIFIISLISVQFAIEFLTEIADALRALHALGFVLGLGSAIAGLVLFAKFLNDRNIDDSESKTIQMLFELIWLGLVLTIVSQLTFFVAAPAALVSSGLFLVQTLALVVAAVGSAMLMILFAPFLPVIPFSEDSLPNAGPSPLASMRRPVFITGSITLSSWVIAFVMDYVPEAGFISLLLVYVLVLAVAVVLGLVRERSISKPNTNHS